jgi:hypothetical protein
MGCDVYVYDETMTVIHSTEIGVIDILATDQSGDKLDSRSGRAVPGSGGARAAAHRLGGRPVGGVGARRLRAFPRHTPSPCRCHPLPAPRARKRPQRGGPQTPEQVAEFTQAQAGRWTASEAAARAAQPPLGPRAAAAPAARAVTRLARRSIGTALDILSLINHKLPII